MVLRYVCERREHACVIDLWLIGFRGGGDDVDHEGRCFSLKEGWDYVYLVSGLWLCLEQDQTNEYSSIHVQLA